MRGVIQGTEFLLILLCRIGTCLFNVSVKKNFQTFQHVLGLLNRVHGKAFGTIKSSTRSSAWKCLWSLMSLTPGLVFDKIDFLTAYIKP